MIKERDNSIDILRCIGLFLVILAHVGAPSWINDLREFDVVLMVYVMCASFSCSNSVSYPFYIFKRFKKLILSCWIFLIIYYTAYYIFSIVFSVEFGYDFDTMLSSFVYFQNFGGIWIIRVYFMIALVTPLIYKFVLKSESKKQIFFWLSVIIIYIIYYFSILVYSQINSVAVITLLIESIGWIICALICLKVLNSTTKTKFVFACLMLVVFIIFAYINKIESISDYKWPPTIIYLSYGLGVSLLLQLSLKIKLHGEYISDGLCRKFRQIFWISKNSLWIYYWHLLYLSIGRYILEKIPDLNYWFVLYIFVIVLSILTTATINFVKSKIKKKGLKIYG